MKMSLKVICLLWLNKISAVQEIDKTILGIHLARSNLWEGAEYVWTFTAIEIQKPVIAMP